MTTPRSDTDNWAKPVQSLRADGTSVGARDTVTGRRLTGPLGGFGKLYDKRYRIRLPGVSATPADVVRVWKTQYADFWPPGNHFFAPLSGLRPGEVALIKSAQGPVKLSTGIMVLYADDVSFTFMTPEGHPFSGWITFSADDDEPDGVVAAQVQLQIRPSDPMFDIGMLFGGNRMEDRWWETTLRRLAGHFGVRSADVDSKVQVLDRRRQWRNIGQLRYNPILRSFVPHRKKKDPRARN